MTLDQPILRDLDEKGEWIFAGTTEDDEAGHWEVFFSETEAMAAADEYMTETPADQAPNVWVARVTRVVTSYYDHRPQEAGL